MTEKAFAEIAGRSIQLFNSMNLDGWQQAGSGGFRIDNGMLVTVRSSAQAHSARYCRRFENAGLQYEVRSCPCAEQRKSSCKGRHWCRERSMSLAKAGKRRIVIEIFYICLRLPSV